MSVAIRCGVDVTTRTSSTEYPVKDFSTQRRLHVVHGQFSDHVHMKTLIVSDLSWRAQRLAADKSESAGHTATYFLPDPEIICPAVGGPGAPVEDDRAGSAVAIGCKATLLAIDDIVRIDGRLARMYAHVTADLSRRMTARDAARFTHLEVHYFSTFFHRRTGVTFGEWYKARRLHHARELLQGGRVSIEAAALAAGYCHRRGFERSFKRYFGVSPGTVLTLGRSNGQRESQNRPQHS